MNTSIPHKRALNCEVSAYNEAFNRPTTELWLMDHPGPSGSSFFIPIYKNLLRKSVSPPFVTATQSSTHPLTEIKQTVRRGSLIFYLPTENGEPCLINLLLFSVASTTTYIENRSFSYHENLFGIRKIICETFLNEDCGRNMGKQRIISVRNGTGILITCLSQFYLSHFVYDNAVAAELLWLTAAECCSD